MIWGWMGTQLAQRRTPSRQLTFALTVTPTLGGHMSQALFKVTSTSCSISISVPTIPLTCPSVTSVFLTCTAYVSRMLRWMVNFRSPRDQAPASSKCLALFLPTSVADDHVFGRTDDSFHARLGDLRVVCMDVFITIVKTQDIL